MKMVISSRHGWTIVAACALALAAGCASRRGEAGAEGTAAVEARETWGLDNPSSKIPFRTFTTTELKAASVSAAVGKRRGVDEFARRFDAALKHDLERLLPRLEAVPRGVELARTQGATLQIVPQVEHAKVVSRFERGWFTWGAGDVELIVRVAFVDGKTGEILAEPVFRREGELFWGAWSNGLSDEDAEKSLVEDVVQYARDNR